MKQTIRLGLLIASVFFFATLLYHPLSPLPSLRSKAPDAQATKDYIESLSPFHKGSSSSLSSTPARPDAPVPSEADLDVAKPKGDAASLRKIPLTSLKEDDTKADKAEQGHDKPTDADQQQSKEVEAGPLTEALKEGEPIAPPLFNATLKAELGQAAWKLFHTTLARIPLEITSKTQRADLEHYLRSFAVYYPCGDCSRHFQQLLKKYPPQTSGRVAASLWGCRMHNAVNERLGKPEYDCKTILKDYDCGCGDDEKKAKEGEDPSSGSSTSAAADKGATSPA